MRIGVDVGGTKIEAAALDGGGTWLCRRRVETPRGDYAATLDAIAGLIGAVEAEIGTTGTVGVGIPGTLSPATGLVKNANSTWLIGRPLDRDLATRLGRPVRIANDANCFALSEAVDGAAAGASVVFGVILGTGVGGGIVVDGRVLAGRNAIAGEWGHNPLPWPRDDERPGPACYCGQRGCIETFLSGPGLARDHGGAGGRLGRPTYALRKQGAPLGAPGGADDAMRIAERAAAGEPAARAALDRYEDRLARGLASVINVLDPDVLVLGGGLSNIERLIPGVRRRLDRYVFSDRIDTRLVRARHGDSGGVRGAAWLWSADEAAGAP